MLFVGLDQDNFNEVINKERFNIFVYPATNTKRLNIILHTILFLKYKYIYIYIKYSIGFWKSLLSFV